MLIPPFQIDGNFGCTAGIAEMLVQSHEGFINLLPALPDVWKKEGEVKGMMARGNFEISDMVWRNGKVIHLTIRSNIGGRLKVKVNGKMLSRKTSAGKLYSII
jgi:alpha-L-fucosidase 2